MQRSFKTAREVVVMIRWHRPLYVDENIRESPAAIRRRFRFRKYPGDYYFITIPQGRDMPEIIKAVYLKGQIHRSPEVLIAGVASGKDRALALFAKMAQDAYDATGQVNIRAFLKQQSRS